MSAARRVEILGSPVDVLSLAGTVARAETAMRERACLHQVSLNAAKLVKMRTDPVLREDVLASNIISADGMAIVIASRLLGRPLPERVPGIDVMEAVLDVCARQGFRPYLLGATREVLQRAAEAARQRFPGLEIAGMRDGYFKAEEEDAVVADIVAARPDCLFIAMPTPRKERLLNRHRATMRVPFIMGVGGSLDVLAGHVRRAPGWMQRTGLEWLYRVVQEPRRMWWRYASTNTVFAALLARELFSVRVLRSER